MTRVRFDRCQGTIEGSRHQKEKDILHIEHLRTLKLALADELEVARGAEVPIPKQSLYRIRTLRTFTCPLCERTKCLITINYFSFGGS